MPTLLFAALLTALSVLATSPVAAQRYQTRAGTLSFFSKSPLEDIEARSQQTAAVLDLGTGQTAFTVPVRSFEFERKLMQEHFNENYMESERYPKATFAGRVEGADAAKLAGGGTQPVTAEGDLTLHGVTRRIRVPGTLELRPDGHLLVQATFDVAPADYNIKIPALVRAHVAKSVQVRVNLSCAPVAAAAPATTAKP